MENNRSPQGIQVNLPNNVAILYSDSTFLTINQYGVVLDFAQRMGTINQQIIVARVGMSKEHAKILVDKLSDLLIKDTLKQTPVTHSPVIKKSVD